jgi:hypothetical protein
MRQYRWRHRPLASRQARFCTGSMRPLMLHPETCYGSGILLETLSNSVFAFLILVRLFSPSA